MARPTLDHILTVRCELQNERARLDIDAIRLKLMHIGHSRSPKIVSGSECDLSRAMTEILEFHNHRHSSLLRLDLEGSDVEKKGERK